MILFNVVLFVLAVACLPQLPRANKHHDDPKHHAKGHLVHHHGGKHQDGGKQHDDVAKADVASCTEAFQKYHLCRQKRRERTREHREARYQNLTNEIKKCFADFNCAVPSEDPEHVETPDEKSCRDEFFEKRRSKVQACVHEKYPKYQFPEAHPRQPHHDVTLIRFDARQCAQKDKVKECRKNAVQQYRKGRFLRKCGNRGYCLPLLNESCRATLREVKLKKCRCKKHVRPEWKAIRAGIPKCHGVPLKHHPQHDHNHTCHLGGYCRKGLDIFLKDHPTVLHHRNHTTNGAGAKA